MSCAAHRALDRDWPRLERAIARGEWRDLAVELSADDLIRYLHVYPVLDGRELWHTFRLNFATYPGQPPSVQCVHPITKESPKPNQVRWWPRSSSPEINLQPGNDPPYFCFPYTLEFMRTHTPPPGPQLWSPATHTLHATVKALRSLFRAGQYAGYVDPTFEEELRAAVAAQPSAYAPWTRRAAAAPDPAA